MKTIPMLQHRLTPVRTPDRSDVTAMVLAGGRGERMGGQDKGLVKVSGRCIIDQILAQLVPQVDQLLINANRHLDEYRSRGHRVISDTLVDFQGPLAGLLSGLRAATTSHVLTLPCDAPAIPADLVQRMCASLVDGGEIAVAHDGERFQPVYALVPVGLADDLQAFLDGGDRKIMFWFKQHHPVAVDFSDQAQAFHNVNTPADKAHLEQCS